MPYGETYGVTFGDKHSLRDWGIYLKDRPVVDPPEPELILEKIPGSNVTLDLSESLTGDVTYNMRAIKFEFMVRPPRTAWFGIYSEIMDYLHGKRMKIVMDEDPSYYYEGRLTVSEWQSELTSSLIVINASCDPFKYEMYSSIEDWKWDPFNFERDAAREYGNIKVDGSYELLMAGSRMPVVPTFIVDSSDGGGMTVEYEGTVYSLPDGTSRAPDLIVRDGAHTMLFTGNGTVSVDFRGGRL